MSKDKKTFIIGIVLVLLGLGLKFAMPDSQADNLAIAQQAQNAQEA